MKSIFEDFMRPIILQYGFIERPEYRTNSSDNIEKYVISDEWKKRNMEEQIGLLDRKAGYYDSQIEHLVTLKGQILDKKKELQEELEKIK